MEPLSGPLKTLEKEKVDTNAVNYLKEPKGIALSGDISTFSIPDIFSLINLGKKNGVLTFKFENVTKILIFKNGEIASAISYQSNEQLGEWLFKRNKITREQLNLALEEKNRSGDKLGKILVKKEFLGPRELYEETKTRIEEIVYDLFRHNKGKFLFTEGEINEEKIIEILDLKTQQLIMEGIRRIDEEWHSYRQALPSLNILLKRKEQPFGSKEPAHQQIIDLFKRRDSTLTVGEVCLLGQMEEIETYRIIGELIGLNLLEIKEIPKDTEPQEDVIIIE